MKKSTLLKLLVFCIFTLLAYLKLPSATTIHLTGIINDENNQPIEGAEVYLNTLNTIRTFSDNNGNFTLSGDIATSSKKYSPSKYSRPVTLNGHRLITSLKPRLLVKIDIYDIDGKKIDKQSIIPTETGLVIVNIPFSKLSSGIYIIVLSQNGAKSILKCIVAERDALAANVAPIQFRSGVSVSGSASEFRDILVVSATGAQTVRRAITIPVEDNIKIKLMPSGVGYITPGIPVYTEKGGIGDVTTYGSVSDPEYSQGGACNYGSTKIRYYAAINVNQLPGDKKGQWQDGQICGRCAKVRIRTTTGEERISFVRIMDKCADDNCGIDLGGAPAGEIMKNQVGRYAGDWEWVNCDGIEGAYDGSPSLYVKAGSNEWWSLVQARNGPGSISQMRIKKVGTAEWQVIEWATEAENFLRIPVEILQDSGEWEIEVDWNTGSKSTIRIVGNKLSVADAEYNFQ